MTGTEALEGRIVALTGAGRGLGLQIARTLLERGARVVANFRSPSADLEQLREKFPELVLVQGDIAEEEAAIELVAAARRLGRLDAVIHNAGIARDQLLVRMPVEDWDEVHRVNLRGAFLLSKHAVKAMLRQRYGRIVYISSGAAILGNAGQAAYAASKAGLHGLSATVAQEYRSYGIRTVVLAPGLLDTGLGEALDEKIIEEKAGRSMLGIGSGTQIAATAAFLASADADYINAVIIRADGGLVY
ncbi:SDR family oxidoreductase [Couchioplanes caeruleus]|uniref:SDR family NAD(P)-dependent oxidoreductase n=1 Tax=Couchioplanes caeruleus TaxID=56438 RepID=UPI0020C08425|nr:SDR family NAD(P)-dependent oxidoreductase [Couchioplanes caeruleus]UQU63864.1 SDR family oxidoreductase [Couchioplanes caeruleus]